MFKSKTAKSTAVASIRYPLLRPGWFPDPRWPQHILHLALAVSDGDDVRPMLHDALAAYSSFDELESNMVWKVLADDLGCDGPNDNGVWNANGVWIGYIVGDSWRGKGYAAVQEFLERNFGPKPAEHP